VRSYRAEVGEKGLSKNATKFLVSLQHDPDLLYREHVKLQKLAIAATTQPSPSTDNGNKPTSLPPSSPTKTDHPDIPQTPTTATATDHDDQINGPSTPRSSVFLNSPIMSSPSYHFSSSAPDSYLLDPSMTLPFILPTSTDMLISYGAGFGGTNKERARKYIPTVPTEVLSRFDRV
jgi:hypothetical protein